MSTLNTTNDARLTWIDPAIATLDVADTATNAAGPGGDGGKIPDQTKS